MALGFGRKKAADDDATSSANTSPAADEQAAPVAAHAPSSPSNPDFDVFDLEAFNDAPPDVAPPGPLSDELFADLNAPPPGTRLTSSSSAFEFPEGATPEPATTEPALLSASEPGALDFDDLFVAEQHNAEQQNAAQQAMPVAAPAPFVPPSVLAAHSAPPFYEPQVPGAVEPARAGKKLPLLPILGTLGILALGGGAAYFLNRGTPEPDETAPVSSSRSTSASDAPQSQAPRSAPAVKVIKVKPVPVVVDPLPAAPSTVRPGIAPAPDQKSQLKVLWNRGADAKHRRDYDSARRYWSQALKIAPGNAGFKESLAKLPR